MSISLLVLNILNICRSILLLMVHRVWDVLLSADEVDCMAGNKAFGMECACDETCNVSPVLFRLWEYTSGTYSGSLHMTLLSAAPTFARSDRRSTWREWVGMLLVRFPVRIGDVPCLDLSLVGGLSFQGVWVLRESEVKEVLMAFSGGSIPE